VKELSGNEVLALPLRLHGIELGRPVDVLLDRETPRVVGLDVLCGDEEHRFLPLPTAVVGDDGLAIHSPLVLLEEDELGFYRARAFSLQALRGKPVMRKQANVGTLRDVVFRTDGALLAVELESGERIPYEAALGFAPARRTAA
jgi:sporulation protein YlmC with PRC-barrel domain